jgi:hypothetical protein
VEIQGKLIKRRYKKGYPNDIGGLGRKKGKIKQKAQFKPLFPVNSCEFCEF